MSPEFDEGPDDAIDRFWDRVAQGGSNAAESLDPADAATIGRLHAFDDRPGPAGAFKANLRAELMRAPAISVSSDPSPSFAPNHRVAQPRHGPTAPQPRALASFITAALLLLALGLGFLVVRPNRSPAPPALVPAVVAPTNPGTPAPSPAAGVALRTVFATTLPAEALPSGPAMDIAIKPFALAPGVRAALSSDQRGCCPGSEINYVISGELTVQVAGPMRVVRSGSEDTPDISEEVAPGTAVVLRPGDVVEFRYESGVEYTNAGTTAVQFVSGVLIPNVTALPVLPEGLRNVGSGGGDQAYPAPVPPLGPVRVELGRAILEPGEDLAKPPTGGFRVAIAADEEATLAKSRGGVFRNLGSQPVELVVMTVTPAA